MPNELLPYYNRELATLRQLGKEFAERFPKIAGRLVIKEGASEDPHVERLIEAFAFLTARIHHKLDDEFPEITEALLGVLYPHLLRPIPSMSIAQFSVDPQQMNLSSKLEIPRGTQLLSQQIQSISCRFRTAYPVELWPLSVSFAKFEPLDQVDFSMRYKGAAAIIHIRLQVFPGQTLQTLGIQQLRFFMKGEPSAMHLLYELLFNNVLKITLRGGGEEKQLPLDAIRSVGFEEQDGLLDYDSRSSVAYRLLHEYFAFPDKFMFFDLTGLDALTFTPTCQEMEIAIHLSEFERVERLMKLSDTIDADTFRLGCTPIVNLFRQNAEPMQITHLKTEYPVIPDIRRPWAMEVYSVNAVRKLVKDDTRAEVIEYAPFFSLRHTNDASEQQTFWLANRRPTTKAHASNTDVYLALVDLKFEPDQLTSETLSIDLTCTNHDLPSALPFGGTQGNFEIEAGSPVSRIQCLKKPTPTLRPHLGHGTLWRLISHLSLNYLSLIEDEGVGTESFRELLGLYDFSNSAATSKQIKGIYRINSRPTLSKIIGKSQAAFIRGVEVTLELDEDEFEGAGVYLMGAVLERFFGLYGSMNSFTQLVLKTRQREKVMKKWPPRSGRATLL